MTNDQTADASKKPIQIGSVPVYPLDEKQVADLKNRFTYHAPKPGQPERYEQLRREAGELAESILVCTPPSREQSLALTHLETAIFFANAAIARHE